ncbi:MAG: helix-turn-helix transcriptional regulator [Clostridia bacterium]|nr:helix-turn-helix transcriptional regulator [Clostridia bacterium]
MPSTFFETRDEKFFIGEVTHYPFPLHVHEVMEVVAIISGQAVMHIDGKEYTLHPGDVAAIFPLIAHSYDSLSPDIRGLACIFSPDTIAEFSGTLRSMVPLCPVVQAGQTDEEIRLAIAKLTALPAEPDSPYSLAYLHLLLAGLLRHLCYRPVFDYSDQNLGYRIIHYVSRHAFSPITLESASHELGLSPSYLSHFFSQQLHVNFRRFVNAIRIDQARMLMRNPEMTLVRVCYACGFTNIRTFRRAFFQETGVLPSDYLASLQS